MKFKAIGTVFIKWFVVIASLFSCGVWPQSLTVNLSNQNQALTYQTPVRLSQMLLDVEQVVIGDYPLARHLSRNQPNVELDLQLNRVLEQLKQRSVKPNHPSLNESALAIMTQLQQYKFAYRIPLTLDADFSRIQPKSDPVLQYKEGLDTSSFTLYLYSRPATLRIMGAVDKPGLYDFNAHWQLTDYLESNDVSMLSSANKTQAVVIQPDGTIVDLPFGLWNGREVYFAPGATIFIGLHSAFSESRILNQSIAQLLVHKVGL